MSIRAETFERLKDEAWNRDPAFLAMLKAADAKPQSLASGTGKVVLDEYAISIEKMPDGTPAEKYLQQMAVDLNATVSDPYGFDLFNIFERRGSGSVKVGDIYDIDIPFNNGSVALAAMDVDYFVFHTVETPRKYGTHPECGSREFGFEHSGGLVRFYTRGASRPANVMSRMGRFLQTFDWTRLMMGISNSIDRRGGKAKPHSLELFWIEQDYKPASATPPVPQSLPVAPMLYSP